MYEPAKIKKEIINIQVESQRTNENLAGEGAANDCKVKSRERGEPGENQRMNEISQLRLKFLNGCGSTSYFWRRGKETPKFQIL